MKYLIRQSDGSIKQVNGRPVLKKHFPQLDLFLRRELENGLYYFSVSEKITGFGISGGRIPTSTTGRLFADKVINSTIHNINRYGIENTIKLISRLPKLERELNPAEYIFKGKHPKHIARKGQ